MLRFLWNSSRGYRLRPWRSPYLRWRIETYSGVPAESIQAADFIRFLWRERQSLGKYLAWVRRFPKGGDGEDWSRGHFFRERLRAAVKAR
jgi:hypothetical protein